MFGEYSDHYCFSKGAVLSSTIKTSLISSCAHGSLRGPHCPPLYARVWLSQEHSKLCYYFASLSNVIAVAFGGVSVNIDCNKCGQTSCTLGLKVQTGGNSKASEAPGGHFLS